MPKPEDYNSIIEEAAKTHKVDPHLIRAVIHRESSGRAKVLGPKVRGNRRAIGLMQLMPKTARSVGVKDPKDPKQNIMGGTKYLKKMLDRYGNNVPKALGAYNAGPGKVSRNPKMGLPDIPETQDYVSNVIYDYDVRRGAKNRVTTEP